MPQSLLSIERAAAADIARIEYLYFLPGTAPETRAVLARTAHAIGAALAAATMARGTSNA